MLRLKTGAQNRMWKGLWWGGHRVAGARATGTGNTFKGGGEIEGAEGGQIFIIFSFLCVYF